MDEVEEAEEGAAMEVKVSVTRQDIEEGWRSSAIRCPIALALRRDTPAIYAAVWDGGQAELITANVNDELWKAQLPDSAREFIREFDEGGDVQPFAFDVELRKQEVG